MSGAPPAPTPARRAPVRYHPLTRVLHWSMAGLLALQFVVGYSLERADDLLEPLVDLWLGGDDDVLVLVHALIGAAILLLALVRVVVRRTVELPPWAPGLSSLERRLAHRVEQALYAMMFLVPLSGLALVLVSGEDWDLGQREWRAAVELADDDVLLGVHIVTHVTFFLVLAVHVTMVLKHQLVDRDGLLRRML
jgi:cytochrome b561